MIAKLSGHSLRIPRENCLAFAASTFLNITCWYVGRTYSLLYLPAGKTVLLGYTMPVWATVLSIVVFKEPFDKRVALALALGIGGIVVLISEDFGSLGNAPIGIAFILGAAVAWAIGTLLFKRVIWKTSTLALAGWQLLIGCLPMTLVAPFVDMADLQWQSIPMMIGIACNVFVVLAFGNYGWFTLVSLLPVSVSSIGTLMLPMISVAGATIFLDEPFGWRQATAMLGVSAALGLVLFLPRAPARL
ncbi:MAG: hypothetical protein EXQ90_03125 [Rhodospirillales bacterium]|nr:hypothetical protein [Rhodospirillales bacterium]